MLHNIHILSAKLNTVQGYIWNRLHREESHKLDIVYVYVHICVCWFTTLCVYK